MNTSQFLTLILFAFLACGCINGNTDCFPEHRSLLLDLKHGFRLPPGQLDSWEPSSDCCGWEGITCDPKSGHVIGLDLGGRKIAGGINSHALFGLTSLQSLNMSNNEFGRFNLTNIELGRINLTNIEFFPISIPEPGFENLKELRQLDLSNGGFGGQIPNGISRLARLEYLDLSGCYRTVNGSPYSVGSQLEMRNPNFSRMIRNLNNLRVLKLPCVDLHQDPEWVTALVTSMPHLQVLDLRLTNLTGLGDQIPNGIIRLARLEYLDLSVCYQPFGSLELRNPNFSNMIRNLNNLRVLKLGCVDLGQDVEGVTAALVTSVPHLQLLDLQETNLTGTIPESFGNLKNLTEIDLSWNKLTGAIPASIGKLVKLTLLDLSGNSLTGPVPGSLFSLPLLQSLYLMANQLSGELDVSLNASTSLKNIDLSDNQLCGQIPPSFFYLPSLETLHLQSNNFSGAIELDRIANLNKLTSIDLSSNMLYGPIPVPPPFVYYVDFSNNNFSSAIAPEFFFNLSRMQIFLAANNNLSGEIPPSICNATALNVLDISNNLFSGSIPSCLLESDRLTDVNLGRNRLRGTIPRNITKRCQLNSLILSDNHLEGSLPRSLVNCGFLSVLDLGNNHIVDTFPFWLGDHVSLQVLSLRSNRFYGPLGLTERREANYMFPQLQVFDLSSNNFSGKLSPKSFSGLRRMMLNSSRSPSFTQVGVPSSFYEINIAVIKGQDVQLLNILYTVVDFSNNSFEGDIPPVIGGLQGLHVLNLSHNSLTGNIPFELGNLTQLQSLDLSTNHLSGEIPQCLTSLTFLEWLYLSNNNLSGRIPQGGQFSTFPNASFQENPGLCGTPLLKQCGKNAMPPAVISGHSSSLSSYVIGLALSTGIGYGVGIAIVLVLQNVPLKSLREREQVDATS